MYKNLKPYIRVHMFTYDLLNTFDEKLQDYAITHLRKKQNVQVHLGAFVQKVEPNVVHVKLGESAMSIRYGTLVWCAGIKPHPFVNKVSIWLRPWAWTRARPSPSSFTTRSVLVGWIGMLWNAKFSE